MSLFLIIYIDQKLSNLSKGIDYGSVESALEDNEVQLSPNHNPGYRYQNLYFPSDEDTEYDALLGTRREYDPDSAWNIFRQR